MIKCTDKVIEKYPSGDVLVQTAEVSLKADTSAEVISMGATASGVVGLEDGTILSMGSTCLCKDLSFGVLGSNGAWEF